MRAPMRCSWAMADLTTSGSVAPMSEVGTISTAKAQMNRMTVIATSESGSEGAPCTQSCVSQSSTTGEASAVRPTRISATPNAAQRARQPRGQPAREEAADGEAGHEARKHRAGGVDRHPEHQRQQAQPHHLIDERAGARKEEQGRGAGAARRENAEPATKRSPRQQHSKSAPSHPPRLSLPSPGDRPCFARCSPLSSC